MASKTSRRTPRVSTGSGSDIVVVNTTSPARSSSRRSSPRRRSTSRRRSRSSGSRVGGVYSKASFKAQMISLGIGGLAVGWIEKTFGDQIPPVPVLGRKGTIALAAYFLEPKEKLLQDAGKAAAVIAGYELGATGHVTGVGDPYGIAGDDDDDMWFEDDDFTTT